jgi:poly-beta-hydroxyalkanoate depolymerase
MKIAAIDRVSLYLRKMCRVASVDTQAIRFKLLHQLDGIFELAMSVAKGNVKHFRDEEGKEHPVTPKQREKWARIAAYTAQVMHNLTRSFDEKQFQTDLKRLEQMVDEVKREQAGKRDPAVV